MQVNDAQEGIHRKKQRSEKTRLEKGLITLQQNMEAKNTFTSTP
jgi:hypothetical protein